MEIVERTGLGHSDTRCDALAERVSARLCRHYLERFEVILHHNGRQTTEHHADSR